MKTLRSKLFIGFLFAALLFGSLSTPFISNSHATAEGFGATCLTGGTAGCLDAINGALLSDGDKAIVSTATLVYFYNLDADSAAGESSPAIIAPDTNAGDKRWLLQERYIVTIDLTGGQITFPASAAASGDANTIDDYEEGTYTITATCSTSGTVTLEAGQDLGSYTKIGRLVHAQANIIVASVSSPVGYLKILLPFTVLALAEYADRGVGSVTTGGVDLPAGCVGIGLAVMDSVAFGWPRCSTDDGAYANVDAATVATTDEFHFTVTFQGS